MNDPGGPKQLLRVEMMYAFIASDEDGEDVCAFRGPDGWMPLVGADLERVEAMRPLAQRLAANTGQTITLCKFSVREELEVFRAGAT